jgi:hypothetical protein
VLFAAEVAVDRDTVIAWMNAVWGPDSVQACAGQFGGASIAPAAT